MKTGSCVIINQRKAEVLRIKWTMIRVRFLDDLSEAWFPVSQSEAVDD